jgi:aminoglycoside phosphotransferase (APT) family kinase protein
MAALNVKSTLADKLLSYITTKLGYEDIYYVIKPEPAAYDTPETIFRFRIGGVSKELAHTLTLRFYNQNDVPISAHFDRLLQNHLEDQGFPAPRVRFAETDPTILGMPFIVEDEISGLPLHDTAALSAKSHLRLLRKPSPDRINLPHILAEIMSRLHTVDTGLLIRQLQEIRFPFDHISLNGRLYQLYRRIQSVGLIGIEPAIIWLISHSPAESENPVICHGELVPHHIFLHRGSISGVRGWAMNKVILDDPLYDAARTYAELKFSIPRLVTLPRPFSTIIGVLNAEHFFSIYTHNRTIKDDLFKFFILMWCIDIIISVAEAKSETSSVFRRGTLIPVIHNEKTARAAIKYFSNNTGLNLNSVKL